MFQVYEMTWLWNNIRLLQGQSPYCRMPQLNEEAGRGRGMKTDEGGSNGLTISGCATKMHQEKQLLDTHSTPKGSPSFACTESEVLVWGCSHHALIIISWIFAHVWVQPKKISKEIQDVNLNIVGFKADLNDHSTISVNVFDYCSCPCVSVTSSLHNFCQRVDLLIALRSGTLRSP